MKPPKYLIGYTDTTTEPMHFVVRTRNPFCVGVVDLLSARVSLWCGELHKSEGLRLKTASAMLDIAAHWLDFPTPTDFSLHDMAEPPLWLVCDAPESRPDLHHYRYILRTGNPFLLVQCGEVDGVDVGTMLSYDGDAESAAKWMRIAGEKLQKFEEEEIENLEKEYDGY